MRMHPDQVKRVRQLATRLRKLGGRDRLDDVEDPIKQVFMGILMSYASESRAAAAMNRMLSAAVDLNDLRVTPVADVVNFLGRDFPEVRMAAEEILRTLQAVFNRRHDLNLAFLAKASRKGIELFLDSLDTLNPHARALVLLYLDKTTVLPLDRAMYDHLVRQECVPEGADVETAQRLVFNVVKLRESERFYVRFKRFAASHSPRKATFSTSAAGEDEPAPARAKKAAKKATRRKTAKKKAGGRRRGWTRTGRRLRTAGGLFGR